MGRPRIHPPGSTAADRLRASNEALVREGGKRLTVRLSGPVVRALELARETFGYTSDAEAIEQALLREATRAKRAGRR